MSQHTRMNESERKDIDMIGRERYYKKRLPNSIILSQYTMCIKEILLI